MPREPRVHVLSPDASALHPARANRAARRDDPQQARAPAATVPQVGLPLDSLNVDLLNLVVQRQNMALRRQDIVLTSPMDATSSLPVVLRVPVPTQMPDIVSVAATGQPMLPQHALEEFIQEHIAPRLPDAEQPPAPPLDKRRQPGRPGISYLFHGSNNNINGTGESDTSRGGGFPSFSLAPTSVVYGPGCSYMSGGSQAAMADSACFGVFLTAMAAEGRQSPAESRSVTPSDMPSDFDVSAYKSAAEIGFPAWRAWQAKSSTVTVNASPPHYSRSTADVDDPLMGSATSETHVWWKPAKAEVSDDTDPIAVDFSGTARYVGTIQPLRHGDDFSIASDSSLVHLMPMLDADDAEEPEEVAEEVDKTSGGAVQPTVRRVMRPALSATSMAGVSSYAGQSQSSYNVAHLHASVANDLNISF